MNIGVIGAGAIGSAIASEHTQWPITRRMSPSDLGELLHPSQKRGAHYRRALLLTQGRLLAP